MTYESESAQLQAYVQELEACSVEKDALIAKYKAMVKESESEINL